MSAPVYESALTRLVEAVVAALKDDDALQAHLHTATEGRAPDAFLRVYDEGNVPPDLTGRWVALGGPRERWARSHGRLRGGSVAGLLVHLWHTPVTGEDIGRAATYVTWAHVARVLTAKLALGDGFTMLYGTAEIIDVAKDSDRRSWHGIVRYESQIRGAP